MSHARPASPARQRIADVAQRLAAVQNASQSRKMHGYEELLGKITQTQESLMAALEQTEGAARKRDEQPGLYATMLAAGRARGDLEVEEQIDRDLHRTFPGHPALTEPFCQRIKNVLLAYSARNPEVAYCQGMNFVVGSLMQTKMGGLSEQDAFWLVRQLVRHRQKKNKKTQQFLLMV